jgi:hypothetical protein
MEIKEVKTVTIKKWIQIRVDLDGTEYELSVLTLNGRVLGTYENNVSTSDWEYFKKFTPEQRAQHFEQFKEAIGRKKSTAKQ